MQSGFVPAVVFGNVLEYLVRPSLYGLGSTCYGFGAVGTQQEVWSQAVLTLHGDASCCGAWKDSSWLQTGHQQRRQAVPCRILPTATVVCMASTAIRTRQVAGIGIGAGPTR